MAIYSLSWKLLKSKVKSFDLRGYMHMLMFIGLPVYHWSILAEELESVFCDITGRDMSWIRLQNRYCTSYACTIIIVEFPNLSIPPDPWRFIYLKKISNRQRSDSFGNYHEENDCRFDEWDCPFQTSYLLMLIFLTFFSSFKIRRWSWKIGASNFVPKDILGNLHFR